MGVVMHIVMVVVVIKVMRVEATLNVLMCGFDVRQVVDNQLNGMRNDFLDGLKTFGYCFDTSR